jgi:hypothetical protein
MKPTKSPDLPFLYRRVEDVPRETGPRATFQRETTKNEGQ